MAYVMENKNNIDAYIIFIFILNTVITYFIRNLTQISFKDY